MIVEIPADMWNEEVRTAETIPRSLRTRYGVRSRACERSRGAAGQCQAPLIYAARAMPLRQGLAAVERLAEKLAIPLCKPASAASRHSRKTHPLSLGSAAWRCRARAEVPGRGRRDLRHRLLLHRNHRSRSACPRARPSSIQPIRSGTSQQDVESANRLVGDAGSARRRAGKKSARPSHPIATPQPSPPRSRASHKEWLAKWIRS